MQESHSCHEEDNDDNPRKTMRFLFKMIPIVIIGMVVK